MLRRSILQIIKENFRSLSSYKKPATTCFNFYETAGNNIDKKQPFRQFSTSPWLSVQAKTMDGAGDRKVLTTDYEEILQAQKQGVLIIDVREQSEINETGKLPGSIHIPMNDVPNLLTTLSDEAFKSKFEKSKPDKDTKIIVSCRSGMRSGKVQEAMQKLGYENVYNYSGGWLDWESRQKV